MTNNTNTLHLRNLAHLGDAVYEVYIREKTIRLTQNPKNFHKLTVSLVNAEFQSAVLDVLHDKLTHDEQELVRRGRNMPVTTSRRVNQKTHRPATALEVLIGYLYLEDKERLEEVYKIINLEIEKVLNA
ncbi:MAG: ribonuclease III domain-containing protein [Candidatus Gastranaerophilaceae bacterium]|jgi:ribonuclease-3 family protein